MNNGLFDNVYNPDVLSCLANLSNDEVFTPPEVVNQMLDMLPQELFRNPDTTFLDPACKTGVFLREIAKRLIIGLEPQIPDLQERIDHIFHHQLYGIAITELTSLLSRRGVYCSKYPQSEFSVTKFDNAEGNIKFRKIQHTWEPKELMYDLNGKKIGRCVWCGASRDEYDRSSDLEPHAYEWIHVKDPEVLFNMKFDVIIGNPPYQLSDGGQKASATPLYHKFIEQAKKMKPRYLTMVIPARWYSGGRGLDSFRDTMLNDSRMKTIVDYTDSNDCFPGVDIAGGICYFLWDSNYKGKCKIVNNLNGRQTEAVRALNEFSPFIRYNDAIDIIAKVKSAGEATYNLRVSSQKPFGLRTYVKPMESGDITLRYSGGKGPYQRSAVEAGIEWIDKWKVIMSYLTYDHAGRPDKDGKRRIFSTMEILPPQEVCTETYIVVDALDTLEEAENLLKYLKSQFVRFLVAQITATQHISKSSFSLVPIQDFTQSWSDQELYAKYNLTKEEIDFIESMIKPME